MAMSMHFWVIAVAWFSNSISAAKLDWLREPKGRPFGFPDTPFWNRVSLFIMPIFYPLIQVSG